MARSTIRRAGRRSGRPKRPMDWEYAISAVFGLGPDTIDCVWLIPPLEIREQYTDPTLMATRWFVNTRLETSPAISTINALAVGLIAWDGIDDDDPAIVDCPGPITHGDLDWITRAVVGVPPNTPAGTLGSLVLDSTHLSQARRRLGNQTGLLIAYEAVGEGFVGSITADVRFLLKE